jgi:hypothetical protein
VARQTSAIAHLVLMGDETVTAGLVRRRERGIVTDSQEQARAGEKNAQRGKDSLATGHRRYCSPG